ncbi:hypothetical protein AB0D04_13480 [Streptomyces sp. NPDC048483]|uniref:hypothetical protein n=1 Tax=Streptomyces sp. NPDC048483 TaxID=3154927 RepID=UPI00344194FD
MSYALVDVWERFEADPYAQDILLPFKDRLSLEVRTADQRNALRLLQPITDIIFRNEFTQDEIIEHLSHETEMLEIYSGRLLTDLKFVRTLLALKELLLCECAQLTHLEDLSGLRISNLRLLQLPEDFSFNSLASLPELTELALYSRLPWGSLEGMPASPNLTALRLAGWIDTPLLGVSKWRDLNDLVINAAPTPAEWREIAALPRLTNLYISQYDLAQAAPMHSVKHLQLSPIDSDAQLSLIADTFPNLESISVNCRASLPDITDITPLRRIKGLQVTLNYADTVVGLEEFNSGTVHLYPRPRTADI